MNNTVTITCQAEGFEANWVEYRTAWTAKEIAPLNGDINQRFLDAIKPKIVALHVELTNGMSIETPENLTIDNLLEADMLVWAWLSESPRVAVAMRAGLGKASGRPSFDHNVVMQATKPMTAQNLP